MIHLKTYTPHLGQEAFHYYYNKIYRHLLLLSGIRGGKTVAGARQAIKDAWDNPIQTAPYAIIAPTYPMLKRTTWLEFIIAARPFIKKTNDTDKIATFKNGNLVYGFSATDPDKIRNVTLSGAWVDEAREIPAFRTLWDILLGRVLSTKGKIFITSSPNSYDDMHDIFFENRKEDMGVIRFPTYANTYLDKKEIDSLYDRYDKKFAEQEIGGKIVVFQGQVYYCFDRRVNAGDLAFKVAQYDPKTPICLCCDFNVDPMAWPVVQIKKNSSGLAEIFVIDEIYIRNSSTTENCQEFKSRYPNHQSGLILYGDATGSHRDTRSHVTDWIIIKHELQAYNPISRVPTSNPSEKDRINAVNGMICNSKETRRLFVNPQKCKHLIRDFEQVAFKEGTTQIEKSKDKTLTHPSDAIGYMIEKEFSLNRGEIKGLKI